MQIRTLLPGDVAAIESFLAAHADSSMILYSNLRNSGTADTGARYSGAWVGAVAPDGAIAGIAAHFWNGILNVQAPDPAPVGDLAAAALRASGRPLAGIIGSWAQTVDAWASLHPERPPRHHRREVLFALDIEDLAIPLPLLDGSIQVRRANAGDLPVLAPWYAAYREELGEMPPGPDTDRRAREGVEALIGEGAQFIALQDGIPVAASSFNARLPDTVQIGGVWTPPDARGRGCARVCVAGSLLIARATGAHRSILFTSVDNLPAQRAYRALGYREVGDYGILLDG